MSFQGQSTVLSGGAHRGTVAESPHTRVLLDQRPATPHALMLEHTPAPNREENGDPGPLYARLADDQPHASPKAGSSTKQTPTPQPMDLDGPAVLAPLQEQQQTRQNIIRSTPEAQIIPDSQPSPQTEDI